MGTYVSKPVTEKESTDEEFKHLKCGSSSMQGWRTGQEDAHNAILNYDSVSAFFGVYDGHGGPEVAEYVAKYYPDHLLNSEEYKKGDFENALIKTFLEFDAKILEPANLKELQKIAALKNGEDGNTSSSSYEDLDEISELRKEATMPIDEVLATNYSDNSSHAKMLSPMIRPKKPAESTGTSSKSAIKMDLDEESEEKSESKDSESNKMHTNEANGVEPKVEEETNTNGSKNTEKESKELPKVTNGDKTTEIEKSIKVNGDVKKNGEVVENTTNGDSDPSSAGYIGKGKSGGKGGKVKGKSVITTTKLESPEESKPVPSPTKPKRESAQEAKKVVLSAEDLDSEEDEEDETFAVDGMDDADDDDDDDDDEEDDENGVDEAEDEEDGEEEEGEEEEETDDEMCYGEEDTQICNEFHRTMREEPGFNSGCTACVALLHKHTLYVANVGDSRCVVSRGGKAIEMSLDHKPEDEIESNRITKAGGRVTSDGRVNGGLNLSRAFGDHGYKQNEELSPSEQMISPLPDIKSLNLAPTDEFVIIACDGIWNSMTSQEAVDFVNNYIKEDPNCKMSEICESMFEFCLAPDLDGDGTGCDNMTCIIFAFKDKSMLQDLENDEATKTLLNLQNKNEEETRESQSNGDSAATKRVSEDSSTDSVDKSSEDDRPPQKKAKTE